MSVRRSVLPSDVLPVASSDSSTPINVDDIDAHSGSLVAQASVSETPFSFAVRTKYEGARWRRVRGLHLGLGGVGRSARLTTLAILAWSHPEVSFEHLYEGSYGFITRTERDGAQLVVA